MSDTQGPAAATPEKPKLDGKEKLWVELGPALVFLAAYFIGGRVTEDRGLFVAITAFLPATAAAIGYALWKTRSVPAMLLLSAGLIGVFGVLTLVFDNEVFFYMKPTIAYGLFAAGVFGSMAIGRNAIKLMFSSPQFEGLPENVWKTLGIRFGLFFIAMAGLNELVWRSFDERTWVLFKLFGGMGLTFAFVMANMPLLMKHAAFDDRNDTSA